MLYEEALALSHLRAPRTTLSLCEFYRAKQNKNIACLTRRVAIGLCAGFDDTHRLVLVLTWIADLLKAIKSPKDGKKNENPYLLAAVKQVWRYTTIHADHLRTGYQN